MKDQNIAPIIVGIGKFGVSNHKNQVIKTFALGSCIAICALAPSIAVAGLLHTQLPDSSKNPEKAKQNPAAFADTGIPLLFQEMRKKGCTKYSLVKIKIIGGAKTIKGNHSFDIGMQNILAVKKTLWRFGLGAIAEDVGGDIARTVEVVNGFDIINISHGSKKWYI